MSRLRRLSVLMAVNFVDMIGFMIVLPLLPFYALKLHATPEIIGQLIASFSIAQLLAAPLWGRVSDRYGRRPAVLIGLSASAVAYVVFGLADSVWLLYLSHWGGPGLCGGYRGAGRSGPGAGLAVGRYLGRSDGRPGHRVLCRPLRAGRSRDARRVAVPDQRLLRLALAA